MGGGCILLFIAGRPLSRLVAGRLHQDVAETCRAARSTFRAQASSSASLRSCSASAAAVIGTVWGAGSAVAGTRSLNASNIYGMRIPRRNPLLCNDAQIAAVAGATASGIDSTASE